MLIRLLDTKDIVHLITLMKVTWKEAYPKFCLQEPAILEKIFAVDKVTDELNSQQTRFVGAFENGSLVGYAKLELSPNQSFLDKIYIAKKYQRQGIGKQLLSACMQVSVKNGLYNMALEVEDNNTRAIAFYKKYGFECQPIKRLFPSTGPVLYYDYIMKCSDLENSPAWSDKPIIMEEKLNLNITTSI